MKGDSTTTVFSFFLTKYDDLCKITWNWVDKDGMDETAWEKVEELVESCIESQQGHWASFALIEPVLGRVSETVPSDKGLERLCKKVVDEFVFTQEFGAMVVRLENRRVVEVIKEAVKGLDNVPNTVGLALGLDISTQSIAGE